MSSKPRLFALLGFLLVFFTVLSPNPVAAAPIPFATLNAPVNAMLGEEFSFELEFDNTGTQTGYGPFVDLIMPFNGTDGPSNPDGIDFLEATAYGTPLDAVVQIFGASGCVAHPFARDTSNTAIQICGRTGDKLVSIRLPFSGIPIGMPPVSISIRALMDADADNGMVQTMRVSGGFALGTNPANDPCCDPLIKTPNSGNSATWPSTGVIPTLLTYSKESDAADDPSEMATGSNFTQRYTLTVDIANGASIANLVVTDLMPSDIQYEGNLTVSPAIAFTSTVPAALGDDLIINFTVPVVGTLATNDLEIEFDFSIPQLNASASAVLNPATGASTIVSNNAQVAGDWTPNDPADLAISGIITCVCGAPLDAIVARSLALQKTITIVNDTAPAGLSPNDRLEHRLAFQVSDFFEAQNFFIDDIFSDGQSFLPAFTPSYSLIDMDGVDNANFTLGGDLIFTALPTGGGNLQFDLSGAVNARLTGGEFAQTGVTGAIGEIVYFTQVDEDFFSAASGDDSFDLGDILDNSATITAEIHGEDPSNPPFVTITETGFDEIELVPAEIVKEVYAWNGVVCAPCAGIEPSPNDTVSYRIQYPLALVDYEELELRDFLPSPVFSAAEVTNFDTTPSLVPPAAGTAQYGTNDTLHLVRPTPTIAHTPADNLLIFDYSSRDSVASGAAEIDIIFTVTVTNAPFTNRYLLSNLVELHGQRSDNSTYSRVDAAALRVLQPLLAIRKGIVATTNPASVYDPALPASVTFPPPSTGGAAFTGVLSSNALALADLNSDLDGGLSGDILTFAIVIENTGAAEDGAFDVVVRDVLQAGFKFPAAGLNIKVQRGDGTMMSFTGAESDLFGAGIQLVDPSPTEGVCAAFDATTGRNIVVVTYDLEIDSAGPASGVLVNQGAVSQFGSGNGVAASNNHVSDIRFFRDRAEVRNITFRHILTTGTTDAEVAENAGIAPIVSKMGFLRSSNSIEWVISVANTSPSPMTNILISDTLRSELQLTSASSTLGTVTINGQTLTMAIPSLGAGETALVTIVTRVLGSLPESLTNTASVTGDNILSQTVTGIVVSSLPQTGETPLFYAVLQSGLLGVLALFLASTIYKRLA